MFADVWLKYLKDGPDTRQDLLLEPHHRTPVATLAKAVHERLGDVEADHRLAYAGEYVAVQLTLRELLAAVLPLSTWWRGPQPAHGTARSSSSSRTSPKAPTLTPEPGGEPQPVPPPDDELAWWLRVAAALLTDASDARS